jgi:hypothetical protein
MAGSPVPSIETQDCYAELGECSGEVSKQELIVRRVVRWVKGNKAGTKRSSRDGQRRPRNRLSVQNNYANVPHTTIDQADSLRK